MAESIPKEKKFLPWLGAALLLLSLAVAAWLLFWLVSLPDLVMDAFPTSGSLGTLVIEMGALGALTMASMQTMRDVVPVRGWFHKRRFRWWLKSGAFEAQQALNKTSETAGSEKATAAGAPAPDKAAAPSETPAIQKAEDLLEAATTPATSGFFDLPVEQLCGQISAAADVALAHPNKYEALLYALGRAPGAKDVREFVGFAGKKDKVPEVAIPLPFPKKETSTESSRELVDVRSRLAYLIQRHVDAFQVDTSQRWRRALRLTAIGVGTIFAFSVSRGHRPQMPWADTAGASIAVGLVAGFLASVARDLTAVVERLRSR